MSDREYPPQRFGVAPTPRSALWVDELYGPHNSYRETPNGYINRHNTAGLKTPESCDLPINWVTELHPGILLEVAALAQFCYSHESAVDIGLVPYDGEEDTYMVAVGRADSDDEYVVVGAPRVDPRDGDSE
jgi:hypothetical protein